MVLLMLAYMLVLHFVADFLLQSREMGQKKSSELNWLIAHLLIQASLFVLGLAPFGIVLAMKISAINTIVHGVIDWHIWRGYKFLVLRKLIKQVKVEGAREDQMADQIAVKAKAWKYWEDHWFYSTIGLDQLLHALTIVALCGIFFL